MDTPRNSIRLALAALATTAAFTTPAASAPRYVSLTVENDLFAGYDRHYTNGVQLAALVDRANLPDTLDRLAPFRWSADSQVVLAVGQRIYTPDDIESAVADPRDRPYAGWLYALADVRTANGRVIDHVTTTVGIVGPSALAKQTQNNFHHFLGKERAHGWRSQLRDEPAFTIGFERAWRGVAYGSVEGLRYDLSPRVGVTLGNVLTYANAGLVARIGSNLPSDIPATHISVGPARDGYRGAAAPGWYVWAGLDGRAVARNVFLDGNTWKDSPSVDRKPLGFDAQLGIAATWPGGRVGFTFVRRSKEYEGQPGADRFGQLAVSFAY